jgi:hypothetical protein
MLLAEVTNGGQNTAIKSGNQTKVDTPICKVDEVVAPMTTHGEVLLKRNHICSDEQTGNRPTEQDIKR